MADQDPSYRRVEIDSEADLFLGVQAELTKMIERLQSYRMDPDLVGVYLVMARHPDGNEDTLLVGGMTVGQTDVLVLMEESARAKIQAQLRHERDE